MTKEVIYIIANRRFEGSWTDSLAYLLILAAGLGAFTGVQFILLFSIGELVLWELVTGAVLLFVSVCLGIVMVNRIKWRNVFEEVRTGKDQATNFEVCSEIIRVWRGGQARRYGKSGVYRAKEIESDDWNFTINATLHYHRYSFLRSNLMIVCLDKIILVNERHEFVGLIPRHGRKELTDLIAMKFNAVETRSNNLKQASIIK